MYQTFSSKKEESIKKFFCIHFFQKSIFSCKNIKVLQRNHSQKMILNVRQALFALSHES